MPKDVKLRLKRSLFVALSAGRHPRRAAQVCRFGAHSHGGGNGRARFTEEQIADFLQQSQNGVQNKALCEEYGLLNSTLRRWQEKHAESIRRGIKTDRIYHEWSFYAFIVAAILLTLMFPVKPRADSLLT